jgi:hypothetical protein
VEDHSLKRSGWFPRYTLRTLHGYLLVAEGHLLLLERGFC